MKQPLKILNPNENPSAAKIPNEKNPNQYFNLFT